MSIAVTTASSQANALREDRQARSARAYHAARRHSALVRLLRKAIPIGAVISFTTFVVWPFIDPLRGTSVSVGAVKLDGTRVTMENPRMTGHRRDNRPFEVTAATATQDIRRPTIIEMTDMQANMIQQDDRRLRLAARSATYDTQREQLQMRQGVQIRTEDGQEVDLRSADVDFKAGTVRSQDTVEVRMPDMAVRADTLDITESGAVISFVGRVAALLDDKPASAPRATPQPSPRTPAPTIPMVPEFPPAREPQQPAQAGPPAQPPVAARAPTPRAQPPAAAAGGARSVAVIDPVTGQARTPAPASR